MSKNVTIKEGDTAKTFSSVKKIRINNFPSGSSYWVPEDETKLGTKHITKNGTYIAANEEDDEGQNRGWYGYEKVSVSGIGKASGRPKAGDTLDGVELDPDNDAMIEKEEKVNPETGEKTTKFKVTRLPYTIQFAQYPTKMSYTNGENITLMGATVRGVLSDFTPWEGNEKYINGIIPLEELSISPTVAEIEGYPVQKYTRDGHVVKYVGPVRTVPYNPGPIAVDMNVYIDGNTFTIQNPAARNAGGGNYNVSTNGTFTGQFYGVAGEPVDFYYAQQEGQSSYSLVTMSRGFNLEEGARIYTVWTYESGKIPDGSNSDKWSDGEGINALKIHLKANEIYNGTLWTVMRDGEISEQTLRPQSKDADIFLTQYNGTLYILTEPSQIIHFMRKVNNAWSYYWGNTSPNYWAGFLFNISSSMIPESTVQPSGGSGSLEPISEKVTVSWTRPDGNICNMEYEIEVRESNE